MNQPYNERDALFSSIFSDGTPMFRQPAEPEPWDFVSIRLRIRKDADAQVLMLRGFPCEQVKMSKFKSDDCFDWYEAKLYCRETPVL